MAEVKWTARRVSDGVLVDVTGDTTGTPTPAPTQNALEGGAGGGAIPDPATGEPGDVPQVNAGQDGYELAPASTVVLTGDETSPGTLYRGDAEPTDPVPTEGDVWVDTTGGLPFQHKVYDGAVWVPVPMVVKDAMGVIIAKVDLSGVPGEVAIAATGGSGIALNVAEGASIVTLGIDGSVLIEGASGVGEVAIADNGQVSVETPWGGLFLSANGLEYADLVVKPAGGVFLNLPGADPAEAGQLWDDAGTVKVSAG